MARVSTYLNFGGTTEEAFDFYKTVFGTEFISPIMRYSDMPAQRGQPPMSDYHKNLVMNIALPILGGHVLMGTDIFELKLGTTVTLNLEPDTRAETEQLFKALAVGGKVEQPPQNMFWGGCSTSEF
ncbi:MAG: PhnB protein [Cellvibrionaceae bacterium]|jgi:PhnB protein